MGIAATDPTIMELTDAVYKQEQNTQLAQGGAASGQGGSASTASSWFAAGSANLRTPTDSGGGFAAAMMGVLFRWFMGVCAVVVLAVVAFFGYKKRGDACRKCCFDKIFVWFGVRKRPNYSPQELAAMWDDDDGL